LAPLGSAPIPEEFTCLVRIDVSLPLRSQWAAIKQRLEQHYVRHVPPDRLLKRKIQFDKFPRYLRLLDFEDAAELDSVIGEHLFPDSDAETRRTLLRDSRNAAKAWQRDYNRVAAYTS
jgi:hypothetical protein